LACLYVAFRYQVDFRLAAELAGMHPIPHRELVQEGLKAAYETALIMLPGVCVSFVAGRKIANALKNSFANGLKINSQMSLLLGVSTGAWIIVLEQTRFLFLTRSRNGPEVYLPMFFAMALVFFVLYFSINFTLSTLLWAVKRKYP
jgi:hypothetical protein